MKPHCFVAMPFGIKKDADGQDIDFNAVYFDLLKPAIEAAGLEPFRADEEKSAGDILKDMFQELLIADLVVADLTINNPNVWYEVGVRAALRARGLVLVTGPRKDVVFDNYSIRKQLYRLKDGRPDPAFLAADIKAIAGMIRATMEAWHEKRESPVFYHLQELEEPEWKRLKIGEVRKFWHRHEEWEARIELARRDGLMGDLLVLADEAPVAAFRAEARLKAGIALRKAGRFRFALEQLEAGLAVEPDHLPALREKGICLQRLAQEGAQEHSLERARQHLQKVLERHPYDAETWALLGRMDKDAWIAAWRLEAADTEQIRAEAAYEDALLKSAIDSYYQGFRAQPGHYYSGINALALMHLYRDLTGETAYDAELAILAGAVRFALDIPDPPDFWSRATRGDLEVLVGTPDSVTRAYKDAVALAEKDWFALDSTRAQLVLLQQLGFRPENVAAGLAVLDRALKRLLPPAGAWQPRKVFLFSGHMVDAPDRAEPRFPADRVDLAAKRIAEWLDRQNAGPEDMALTQGAAGGDLLFAEACQVRGVRVLLLQPFEEAEFIQRSVRPSADGEDWVRRYYALKEGLQDPPRCLPAALGPAPHGTDPFERCNLWLLYTAFSQGIPRVHFLCLWNGEGGDGPGGTAHMYREVERRTGQVAWLDTRNLV